MRDNSHRIGGIMKKTNIRIKKNLVALAIFTTGLFVSSEVVSANTAEQPLATEVVENILTTYEAEPVESEPVATTEEEWEYVITAEERDMLASLVYLEARGESYECQKMVVSTVMNKWDYFGGSLEDIIYAPGQYETAPYIASTQADAASYAVVDDVCKNGTNLPPYVFYFREGYYHSWGDQQPYTALDSTYFSYSAKQVDDVLAKEAAEDEAEAQAKAEEEAEKARQAEIEAQQAFNKTQWAKDTTYTLSCEDENHSSDCIKRAIIEKEPLESGSIVEINNNLYAVKNGEIALKAIELYHHVDMSSSPIQTVTIIDPI